ncbi:MAG: glycosyl transferase family 90 [Chlamydiota bacterium]
MKKVNKAILTVLGLLLAVPLSYLVIYKQRKATFQREIIEAKVTTGELAKYYDATRYLHAREFLTQRKKAPKRKKSGGHFEPSSRKVYCQLPDLKAFLVAIQSPPSWITDQLKVAFDHYHRGFLAVVDRAQIESILLSHRSITKYKIDRGKLYFKSFNHPDRRAEAVTAAIYRILAVVPLPDMEFFLSSDDAFWSELPEPVLTFCRPKNCPFSITIPDYEMLAGYQALDERLDRMCERYPWDKKKNSAFWRGATTGGDFSQPDWRSLPRARLVFLSKEAPHAINAYFHALGPEAQANPEMQANTSLVGGFISPEDALQYKYLIDVDGNASGYSRYYWILRSNSVPFKQASFFTQWYYGALKPGIHYVPCQGDFSDLLEKIAWANNHDDEVRKIAEASALFAYRELTVENIHAYLYFVLLEIAAIKTPSC